ncbi:MAG: metal ABC transporter permease [Tannerella sp.]|jgi:ABC-type Mn2+/Zn2+ transport system permease subunit|nr:metal ABC transporter permease [Tannerella sp.]
MLEMLSLPPVLKGLVLISVTGFAFPLTGVYLLRLNLLPLRFMLMHGAILGGAMALALEWNIFATTMAVNLLLVLLMARMSRSLRADAGYISALLMVLTVSLAFILVYKFDVKAKDTLEVLWGSLYSSSWGEVVAVSVFSASLAGFQIMCFRGLQAMFFDREIAFTAGVNEKMLYYTTVLLTSFTVALAMRITGALLLDALLLLPAIIVTFFARSLKGVIIGASALGGAFAVSGFFLSLMLDIPASSAIAIVAVAVFIVMILRRRAMLLVIMAPLLFACHNKPAETQYVVATTSWTAAYARLAGADSVVMLAPFDMQHPAEYELRPSDITKLTSARLIIFAGYETMTKRLQSGLDIDDAKLLKIRTDYTYSEIELSVMQIASKLGTDSMARANLLQVKQLYDDARTMVKQSGIISQPVAVERFMKPFADELGLNIVAVFGPAPPEARVLADIAKAKPALIIDNYHNRAGASLAEVVPEARYILLLNFPGAFGTQTIQDVIRTNELKIKN